MKFLGLLVVSLVAIFSFSCNQKKASKAASVVTEQKPFVVVIPSYNNAEWVKKNLRSVFEQQYDNYRILFIDDASTDSTLAQAQALTLDYNLSERVSLVHNETNQGAAANIYRAVHTCKKNEIVVILDGDDFFAHDKVLSRLNEIYANPNVWLTYGSYIEYPNYNYTVANFASQVPFDVLKKGTIRAYSKEHWSLSHLRSFYAGLFHQIKLEDILFEGAYLDAACDLAFMIPLAEMAGERTHFVDEVLYLYNRANPLNDHKVRAKRQQAMAAHILQLPSYQKRRQLDFTPIQQSDSADLMVFSFDRPLQLYAFLESMETYCTGLGQVQILYRCSNETYEKAYKEVKKRFPAVVFTQQSSAPQLDFKPLLIQFLHESPSDYILFAVDDDLIHDPIDLKADTAALKQTGAYGFFYRLGKEIDYCYMLDKPQQIPPLVEVDPDRFAWDFGQGERDWAYPASVDLTLYSKQEVVRQIEKLPFIHPNSLESLWNNKTHHKRIGLCHATAKMVNIPLNLVNLSTNRAMQSYSPQELLEQFNQGLKMDIEPLKNYSHHSAHVEYNPTFILR